MLVTSRVLLGAAEGPAFPVAQQTTQSWFPNHRRNLPGALIVLGITLGVLVAAPELTWVIHHHGWRSAVTVVALAGAAWALLWIPLGGEGPYAATPDNDFLASAGSGERTGTVEGQGLEGRGRPRAGRRTVGSSRPVPGSVPRSPISAPTGSSPSAWSGSLLPPRRPGLFLGRIRPAADAGLGSERRRGARTGRRGRVAAAPWHREPMGPRRGRRHPSAHRRRGVPGPAVGSGRCGDGRAPGHRFRAHRSDGQRRHHRRRTGPGPPPRRGPGPHERCGDHRRPDRPDTDRAPRGQPGASGLPGRCPDHRCPAPDRRNRRHHAHRPNPCGASTSTPTPTSTRPPSTPSPAANGSRRANPHASLATSAPASPICSWLWEPRPR